MDKPTRDRIREALSSPESFKVLVEMLIEAKGDTLLETVRNVILTKIQARLKGFKSITTDHYNRTRHSSDVKCPGEYCLDAVVDGSTKMNATSLYKLLKIVSGDFRVVNAYYSQNGTYVIYKVRSPKEVARDDLDKLKKKSRTMLNEVNATIKKIKKLGITSSELTDLEKYKQTLQEINE